MRILLVLAVSVSLFLALLPPPRCRLLLLRARDNIAEMLYLGLRHFQAHGKHYGVPDERAKLGEGAEATTSF